MRMSQLREKEVINICDGERLGNVCDVDFEKKTGRICSLIIPGPCKVLGILGEIRNILFLTSRSNGSARM